MVEYTYSQRLGSMQMSKNFFLLQSTGQIENCTGHLGHSSVYIIRHLGQYATIKLTHVFMVEEWQLNVDFDSKHKILWGETRAHRVPIHEKKLKTKICITIPSPYNIRLRHVGGGGGKLHCASSRLSKQYRTQKSPVDVSFFIC